MSAARFEIVRTEDGYFARFVAANNRIVWVTPGLLSRRRTAVAAIRSVVDSFVTDAFFVWDGPLGTLLTPFSDVEVRDIDEREVTP